MTFSPIDGAPRVRLTEEQWRAAETDDAAAEVRAAALLARGGPVRLQVRSWAGDRALVANLGSTQEAAAGAVRVSVVEDGGRVVPTEEVELSVFGPDRLVLEALRMFPPDVAPVADPPGAFVLPAEAALVMSRALREQDEAVAREAARMAGLDDVPLLLESLSASLRADATVTVLAGEEPVVVRRWLQCHLGWVAVSVTPDGVLHAPVDRAGILNQLVADVVAAWERVLSAEDGAA